MKKIEINKKKLILSVLVAALTAFILFYIFLPPINLRSPGFWIYLTVIIASALIPFIDFASFSNEIKENWKSKTQDGIKYKNKSATLARQKWIFIAIAVPLIILIVGEIFSSTFFFSRKYAAVIDVKESVFEEDLPETKEITNIALMDSASATMLGNKELGALSHVVSQYDVGENYTQINYKGAPKKVANLEYDGFFKWLGNNKNGVPGMVMVDPVKSYAEYMEFDDPMYYVDSAFFNQDLTRKLRFSYPTKIFNSISFEVDDNGKPYYIVSCAKPSVSMFGAMDINEVIIFDPATGESEIYSVEDSPKWIDIVYTGYLASEKYNWYGTLSGGFINSVIGNKGCKQTTDDFGYIALEDDVWYFTGVTSVSADKSNIGFVLSNARTGEYKFYPVIGAEEHSAMSAAEGEVQEKGYVASFPSLVNISGEATYIMVLKDAAGLVKLYALVNVENYSIVATGSTQTEAMNSYKKLLKQNDLVTDSDKEIIVIVKDVRIAVVADVTTVYITAESGDVYKGYLEADESLILIQKGDIISVTYTDGDTERIHIISSWRFDEGKIEGGEIY